MPVSPPTTSARIFIDNRSSDSTPRVNVNTGIALVNGGSAAANAPYTLRDRAGEILAEGHGTIAAGAHVAKLINELKDLAPDIEFPANFQTDIQFGSLDIDSDQPLSL